MKLKVKITEIKTTGNTTIVVYQVKRGESKECRQKYFPSTTQLGELVRMLNLEGEANE